MALSCGATVMFFFHFHLIQCFFIRLNEWMHEWIIEICKQMKDYNKSPYLYWDFHRKWQFNVPFTYSLRFHSNSIQDENISARLFCWCRTTCLLYWFPLLSSIWFNRIENYYWPISCIFNFFLCLFRNCVPIYIFSSVLNYRIQAPINFHESCENQSSIY